jgi:hypothetical protein
MLQSNGRLARLAMNAELSAVGACRIIVPTLFREEYLDYLRVLSREGNPTPFLDAMQRIHALTAEVVDHFVFVTKYRRLAHRRVAGGRGAHSLQGVYALRVPTREPQAA